MSSISESGTSSTSDLPGFHSTYPFPQIYYKIIVPRTRTLRFGGKQTEFVTETYSVDVRAASAPQNATVSGPHGYMNQNSYRLDSLYTAFTSNNIRAAPSGICAFRPTDGNDVEGWREQLEIENFHGRLFNDRFVLVPEVTKNVAIAMHEAKVAAIKASKEEAKVATIKAAQQAR